MVRGNKLHGQGEQVTWPLAALGFKRSVIEAIAGRLQLAMPQPGATRNHPQKAIKSPLKCNQVDATLPRISHF